MGGGLGAGSEQLSKLSVWETLSPKRGKGRWTLGSISFARLSHFTRPNGAVLPAYVSVG